MSLDQLFILLPIVAFIALVAGVIVVFRGTGRIATRSRETKQFRSAIKDLASRTDTMLEAVAGKIDVVRHHDAPPESIRLALAEATETLERYGEEARGWTGAGRAQSIRDDLVAELDRAKRALGIVAHAADILAAPRRGIPDLEAETAIKRGYLNLLHAREAIARNALRAEDVGTFEDPAGRSG
jgi:hypothetical protein